MNVFVTGATGLVGAHTALALLEAGHQVRLLVRNAQVAQQWFAGQGYPVVDLVGGDMLDKPFVKQSMAGCDAVVHAAAVIDLNARNAAQTVKTNLQGLESVVGSACELGVVKILYVSSLSAIFHVAPGVIDENSPLASASAGYSGSKTLCEEKVRQWQAEGYPIISTYPSGVFGPYDPKMSESNKAFTEFVNTMVPVTSSGIQFVDVRDLAKAHCLLLEKPVADDPATERYVLAGHFMAWRDFANTLETAAGVHIRRIVIPGWFFRWLGWLVDMVRYVVPVEFPLSREAMTIVTRSPPAISKRITDVVGLVFTDPVKTMSDTVAWYRSSGDIRR